jgi:hypothetical protein
MLQYSDLGMVQRVTVVPVWLWCFDGENQLKLFNAKECIRLINNGVIFL